MKEPMRNIIPVLVDPAVECNDKLRVILLYILAKNGISNENLEKLLQHGQIEASEKEKITNLSYLNLNVVVDVSIYI